MRNLETEIKKALEILNCINQPECGGAAHVQWHPEAPAQLFSWTALSAPGLPLAPQLQPATGLLYAPPWPLAPSGPPVFSEHHPSVSEYPGKKDKKDYEVYFPIFVFPIFTSL